MELIVPVLESSWGVFLHVLSKDFELLELGECLNHVPSSIREPVESILDTWFWDGLDQEVHFFRGVGNIDDFFIHESESDHGQEDEFVFFEKASGNPLINGVSDVKDEESSSSFVFLGSPLNSFEEELNETFQRILIHVVDDAKGDAQEIQHGSFSSHRSVNFSLSVDIDFSHLCDFGLLLNLVCCKLCLLQVVNQFFVVQNRSWVGL